MAGLLDAILGMSGQERTEALRQLGRDLEYYVPPELRGILGLAAEMTPSETLSRAGASGREMLAPDRTAMERLGSAGRMLSETAGVAAPIAAGPRAGMTAAQAIQEGLLGFSVAADDVGRRVVDRLSQPGPVPTMYSNPVGRAADDFNVTRKDASNIFGEGSERVRYTDAKSGGTMEVVVRPDGSASVLELEVPEASRGQGIGQALQQRVMQDFPVMGGQVSSKAAAKTAYRLGRRPYGQPDATLEDVFRMIDEDSSVNLISPQAQPNILPAPRNEAEAMAKQVLEMRAAGRAGDVTEEMMAATDPQYMFANTPLPMDYESRMARARELGRDTPAYRGTLSDEVTARPKQFVSENPDVTQSFAGHISFADEVGLPPELAQAEGGNIMPLLVDPRGNTSALSGYEMLLPGAAIRSRFARFDPAFAHLRNLSAGVGGLGILSLLGQQEQEREQEIRQYLGGLL